MQTARQQNVLHDQSKNLFLHLINTSGVTRGILRTTRTKHSPVFSRNWRNKTACTACRAAKGYSGAHPAREKKASSSDKVCYKPTHVECFFSRACRSTAFDRAGTPEVKRGLVSCSPAEKKPSCSKSGFVCHRTKVLAILQAHAGIYCPLAPIARVAAQIGLQREARRNLLIRGKHPPTPREPCLRCPSHLLIEKASFHGFLRDCLHCSCLEKEFSNSNLHHLYRWPSTVGSQKQTPHPGGAYLSSAQRAPTSSPPTCNTLVWTPRHNVCSSCNAKNLADSWPLLCA